MLAATEGDTGTLSEDGLVSSMAYLIDFWRSVILIFFGSAGDCVNRRDRVGIAYSKLLDIRIVCSALVSPLGHLEPLQQQRTPVVNSWWKDSLILPVQGHAGVNQAYHFNTFASPSPKP